MKHCFTILVFLCQLLSLQVFATTHTVTNSGFNFTPVELSVAVGDTVVFNIGQTHNAVEVSKETYDARNTTSNGGFQVGFGGGTIVITEAKTYYYVCQPHVGFDMVGTIVATAAASGDIFEAKLSGNQEVNPFLTTATGNVTATLDGNTLTVEGQFSSLIGDFDAEIAGGAHIHTGLAGQNGGIALMLSTTVDEDLRGGTFAAADNTFELNEEQLQNLKGRALYINIHTKASPSGELRGQLLPAADAYYGTNLFGSQEVPAIVSPAGGALVMDLHGDTLYVSGSFGNLTGALATDINGGAHLHMGLPGQNGGIIFPLTITLNEDGLGGTVADQFVLTAEQKSMLESRQVYANFHSASFRPGEIRGQVRSLADAVFRVNLSGSNEVAPVVSAGTGRVLLELSGDQLIVSGSFSGMSSDLNTEIGGGAHLHVGFAGENGGVAFPLTTTPGDDNTAGTFAVAGNEFTLTAEQKVLLIGRQMYVNIHSINVPSGELRGQVLPEASYYLNGFLTGMQEADPVLTRASGAVVAEVLGNQLTVSGTFAGLSSDLNTAIAGGAHLHAAPAGSNGPVTFLLTTNSGDDLASGQFEAAANSFTLTDGQLDTLNDRGLYVNIHSLDVASGELRGQLLPEATIYFQAPLSGSSESVPVKSGASGSLLLEWTNGKLTSSGSFNNLGSALNTEIAGGAHLHFGLPGQNGGILFLLSSELENEGLSGIFRAAENTFEVSDMFPDTILGRQLYVNLHSLENGSGELRGQVMPFANAYFTATLAGINEVMPVDTSGNGAFKMELNGNQLVASGSFNGLVGDFDANIGGGSHVHTGMAGENGGIAFNLNATLSEDLKSGTYLPADNTVTLTDEQITALYDASLYVNIHTTAVPSGEIRGQALPETNQFPDSSAIVSPGNGATITIEGQPTTPFEPTWEAATDPDGNPVAYIWQLAADSTFAEPLVVINRKDTTSFATDFGTVNTILTTLGVQPGQTVPVYHRVITSDGSLNTIGDFSVANLALGIVSDVDDLVVAQTSIHTFPNPAVNTIQVEVETIESLAGAIQVRNVQGQLVHQQPMALVPGANKEEINASQWSEGMYFVQLWLEDRLAATKRLVIQR